MKRWTGVMVLVAAVILAAGLNGLMADEKEGGPSGLPNCPVMDEPIDISMRTATDDGPVFFCCGGCIEKYEAKPEKYAEKVAAQRKALKDRAKVQVTCPVSGKSADKEFSIEHDGEKVYFCCSKCPALFESDPAKYKSKLANAYTYQTTCPVSGEEIDPGASTALATGQTIYFCCPKCSKKFDSEPASFVGKLASMGIHVDVKKLGGGEE